MLNDLSKNIENFDKQKRQLLAQFNSIQKTLIDSAKTLDEKKKIVSLIENANKLQSSSIDVDAINQIIKDLQK